MIHCYNEGPDQVGGGLRRGFILSFRFGTVTYPKNEALRAAAAAAASADAAPVETDAPYLDARRATWTAPTSRPSWPRRSAVVAAARNRARAELERVIVPPRAHLVSAPAGP